MTTRYLTKPVSTLRKSFTMDDMKGTTGIVPEDKCANTHATGDKIESVELRLNEDDVNGRSVELTSKKDSYVLMRDCNASTRLTAQHYLWKDLLGYLIHPDIPTGFDDLKIADVATGNGIWLHDVSRSKSTSAELHGFDISLDQVGPKAWLPANIRMHIWNIFDEPPPQFIGYFDIVHVRLITVVVKNNDPQPVLANLAKLLKPGGYLQWDEVDTISSSIKTVPGVSGSSLNKLYSQLKGNNTRDDTWVTLIEKSRVHTTDCHFSWKYRLTEILDENGFTGSLLYTYEYGHGLARLWNDIYVSTWKEFANNVLKTPRMSEDLERKGMEEARNGAAIMTPKLVWVTRKE
ncbi:uncharacterized protein F4807DRAFT_445257 [Annulohypoxylon truncatum]|uniref:uncharacterized protein n=1 Tax=Annulohypoxylon truncatum TaxID=327061 RepID=UPI00200802A2|nr:uncharacterized protein F4807DRAFT_445257 [Annulohypoxylon truncatum]KAI1204851.1 hypothetical protein F4807DRAFT_445257 [Annulohypoxylon truncatum]